MSEVNGRTAAGHRAGRDGQAEGAVRIAVGQGPISNIVASPGGGRLLVTNYGRDTVSIVDTGTRRVTGTVPGLSEPFAIALGGPGGSLAYVSTVSAAYDAIAVIDARTHTVIETHPLALSVSDLAVSPDGGHVYATRNGPHGGDLAVLDTATGRVEAVELPTQPHTTECLRVDPDGSRLYVATNGPAGGRLVSLRADGGPAVVGTIDIGRPVRDVALSPDGAVAYVASCTPVLGAVIDVVDTRTHKITATRKVDAITGLLTRMTLSADGDRAYLVSGDGVAVLCTRTFDVVGALADEPGVAHQPSCVVESPDERCLYIADYAGGVTVAPIAAMGGTRFG